VVLVLIYHQDKMEGDESRYVMFAKNIIAGFYSSPAPNINLWNGPGYPIIIIPFLLFHLPLISITFLNAILQYLSIVFLYKSFITIVPKKVAFVFSLFWGLCFSAYMYISLILTEVFTSFLISLLLYFIAKAFNGKNSKYVILAGFILGYIALTKIIFGYVLILIFFSLLAFYIFDKKDVKLRKSILILIVAFITVSPYLIYTKNLTGKYYYWGNSGGMSLYWMSTPISTEYGDWNNELFTANISDKDISRNISSFKQSHQKEIDEISKFVGVEKDEAYKKMAFRNIKSNPVKYVKNIIANISRAFFGFPVSYTYQYPILRVFFFAIIFTFIMFSTLITFINWNKIEFDVKFVFIFLFFYFSLSMLVSMDNRQLIVVLPGIMFWIGNILNESIFIKFIFDR
jgi:4-amino-4-deoxy-L-arabinose transferase-like glycosyltransferase